MSEEAVLARSRSAFSEYFPQLAARLKQAGGIASSVVMKDGHPADILLDGQLIYGGDARRFAAGQVEAFVKKPLRFFVQRLDMSGMVTEVGQRLIKTIEKGLREDKFGQCTSWPTDNPTFLVVFGLGLGHHLDALLRETQPRWLIVVEPFIEFLDHSCHVVDWSKVLEEFKLKGGSVHVITDSDPQKMVTGIADVVQAKGVPYADGSWVFTHYPFWAFTQARDQLHDAMEFAFINRGFFEDELIMMRNAVENYATYDFWLLEGKPRLRRPELAVIVGAGPSLDESIETLQRIRDRVVLFSGGTALRALLRHGIVPDFHCEIENVPAVFEVMTETAKVADISQICLIASATVDPRVPGLFRDTIFYFRDTVSSTQILGRKHREIAGSGPTCVNLAANIAAVMGFTELALFGTDCGVRQGRSRHATGTIYDDVFTEGNKERGHTMEVEGNFGGVVSTELIYDACRRMLIETFKYYGLSVMNCSDGALITGADPCVPEALEIESPVVDRAAFDLAIERTMQRYAPCDLLKEADFAAIRQKTEAMFADLDQLLAELGAGEADFAAVYDRVMGFVAGAKDSYGRTESIISGSLQALPRIGMFYGFRTAEKEGRRCLFDVFIDEFRAIARDMAAQIYALFDQLDARMPSLPKKANAAGM